MKEAFEIYLYGQALFLALVLWAGMVNMLGRKRHTAPRDRAAKDGADRNGGKLAIKAALDRHEEVDGVHLVQSVSLVRK